ncbi:response regulator transcription factor [Kibdelosporangium aridum]|uniref:DNA-binding response regulator, NarL/FixJ family, contains REC and HTH domains n=1 Tax=Kibdelosporangium aridum TaxID=2030 RepID=A0A1Y5X1B2_KIBAR|nr:response regulator transcription factor [Kibdelosporangium aridum]SMC59182.1 DNA-binding response regulator, NarL/FixJ family, contains REC and HTH domains [Kibdelosporangium aridum]
MIRVLIVDDDAVVRTGLTMMLDGFEDISVVAEAADGVDVPRALDAHPVDVVLMDIRMPKVNGIVATHHVRARPNPPEVIVLTTFDTDDNVLRALRAGASGFLLKDALPSAIINAVVRVAAGEPILSPHITRRLMDRAATSAETYTKARTTLANLSPREHEVAVAVGQGKTNAEIGAELNVSIPTVKAHVTRILTKLDLGNRTQIALLAHDAGLC